MPPMGRKQQRGLASSTSAHTAAGRAAYGRISDAIDQVIQLTQKGDCKGALAAYGAMERAYGEATAHAQSGGQAPSPVGDALRAEAAFFRTCIISGRKFARGSEPPYTRTLPMMPAPGLKGRRRRRKRV